MLTEIAYITSRPNLRGFVCLARALGGSNTPDPPPEKCEYLSQNLSGYQAAAIEIWHSKLEPHWRRRRL